MQASDCNDYLSIWCTGSNMLTFFQDNREVMDFGCVLHLRRSPQFNYDFFRSITMHTMCFKRNRNLIANKSHKSFHKSSVTISSQTRWHCMRLAQYSHCFVSSAVTRGKRCRVGERTKKKKKTHPRIQIQTNTPPVSPLAGKKTNTQRAWGKERAIPFPKHVSYPHPLRLHRGYLLQNYSPLALLLYKQLISSSSIPLTNRLWELLWPARPPQSPLLSPFSVGNNQLDTVPSGLNRTEIICLVYAYVQQ